MASSCASSIAGDAAPAPVAPASAAPAVFLQQGQCVARACFNKQCKRDAAVDSDLCTYHKKNLPRGKIGQPALCKKAKHRKFGKALLRNSGPVVDLSSGDDIEMAPAPANPSVEQIWDSVWSKVSHEKEPDHATTQDFVAFAKFTEMFKDSMAKESLDVIQTPVGPVPSSEKGLVSFLQYMRYHQTSMENCRKKPLLSDQLFRMAGKVRAGAAEYAHKVGLPEYLTPQANYSLWVKKRLAEWALEDSRKQHKKPQQEAVFLTGGQVQEFCLWVICEHLSGAVVTDWVLCAAIALRFQSGTNIRAGNLEKDITWDHTCSKRRHGNFGKVIFMNTKKATPVLGDTKKLVETKYAFERFIDDDITGYLFQEWCDRHRLGRRHGDHFLPAFVDGVMDWTKPLQNKVHNVMLQYAVGAMGWDSSDRLHLYTTTCVRVGNQAATEQEVSHFRAQRNKDCGWAKDSHVPLTHYTPDAIAQAPGPLFWDHEGEKEAYQRACKEYLVQKWNKIICTECGTPFLFDAGRCACDGCAQLMKVRGSGTKASKPHGDFCWRKGGRKPTAVPDGVRKAWAELGVSYDIVYDSVKGYQVH